MFLGLLHVRLELETEPLNRNQMRTGGKKNISHVEGLYNREIRELLLWFLTFSILVANPKNYFARRPTPLMVC